ncbi:MAG: hypothetical protein AB4206_08420 [Xenococcaceae cyanobacterium]
MLLQKELQLSFYHHPQARLAEGCWKEMKTLVEGVPLLSAKSGMRK